jgi:membrane protease YdiL (CAAX protease family)
MSPQREEAPRCHVLASDAPGAPWSRLATADGGHAVDRPEAPRPSDPDPPHAVDPARFNPWNAPAAVSARPRKPFGPRQGLWLIVLFMLVQVGVATTLTVSRGFLIGLVHGLRASLAGQPVGHVLPGPPSPAAIAASVIAAYVLAALWCVRYVLRRAGDRLRLGTPDGIAWRPAEPGAYPMAVALGIGTVAAAAGILHLVPVPPGPAPHSAFQALLMPGWMFGPSLLLLMVIAPCTEEFLFRGAAFAAFAASSGPGWATAIVTVLFVAVHAPEKIHYPPGFVDVSLMALGAAWLRLRYQSIRPAILLHILYNVGVSGMAMLLH